MTPFISSRVRKLDVGISGYTDSDSVLNVTGKVSIGTEIDIVPYDNVNNGTLRLEGSAGTLFSISNNLTSGSIFSVNDVSGIPSFDVNADGTVLLAPFGSSEYVGIGNNAPKSKLDVTGSVIVGDNTNLTGAVYDLHVNGTTPGDITGLRVSQETVSFDVVSWSPTFPSTNNANTVQLISSGKFDIRSDGTPAQIRFYLNGRSNTGYQHALIESNTLVVGSYDRSSSLTTNTKVGNISGPRGSGTDIGSGGLNIIGGESTGTASGGPIKFSTSSAGESSGSTVNTPTERMIITSDGNVGIGISDPTVPLFVQSDSPSAIFKIASVEQTTGFHFAFGWADNSLYHRIRTSGGLNDGFIIENIDAKVQQNFAADGKWSLINDATTSLLTSPSGYVGINGTADPNVELHILTTPAAAGNSGRIGFGDISNFRVAQIEAYRESGSYAGSLIFRTQESVASTGEGLERLRITSTGNVGIGTSTPAQLLHVAGKSQFDDTLYGSSAAAGELKLLSTSGNNNYSAVEIGTVVNSDNGGISFYTAGSSAATERMRIAGTSGNVGIGTDIPSSKVTINYSDATAYSTTLSPSGGFLPSAIDGLAVENTNTSSSNLFSSLHFRSSGSSGTAAGKLILGNSTAGSGFFAFQLRDSAHTSEVREKLRITSSGNVGIGTSTPDSELHVKGSTNSTLILEAVGGDDSRIWFADAFSNNPGVIEYDHNLNKLILGTTDGTADVTIDGSGNVGIGTTTPQSKLDIDGDIIASGDLDLDSGGTYSTTIQSVTPTANRTISFPDQTGTVGLVAGSTGMIQYNDAGKLAASGNFVYANGNVGIGTQSPTEILTVAGNASFVDQNNVERFSVKRITSPLIEYKISANNYFLTLESVGSSQGAILFNTGASSATERLRITSAGLVGIGTSSPGQQLTVATSTGNCYIEAKRASLSAGQVALQLTGGSGGTNWIFYQPVSSNDLRIFGNSSDRVTVTSTGNVGIGTSSPGAQLDILSSGFSNLKVRSSATNSATINLTNSDRNYSFNTNSGDFYIRDESIPSERLRITSAGLVGIGTQSPTEKLEVSGNIKLSSNGTGASASSYELLFYGTSSGSVQKNQAKIQSSPWAPNTNAGVLKFFTNPSLGAITERMRIDGQGNVGIATINPQYKLDIVGTLRVSETTRIGDVIDIVPYNNLDNGTLSFEGSAGQLFSITNNLTSGSIFAVNDVSGIPSLDVDADGTVKVAEFGGDVFFTGLSTDTVFVGTNNNTNTNSSRLVVNGSISETVGGIQYPVVSQVDIGTDPNQIPLNQFLGTMAFADFPFLQSGTSTDGASASVTINAESTDLYSQIASYATDVTFDIINLGIGREIKLYLRNTNAAARTMTIRASATNTGATAVNLAPGAGTMGAASETTVILAANEGTTLIYVANIGGNIVGGILA